MSLVEIQPPPAAESAAILLHASDNVAVARVPLPTGQTVVFGDIRVTLSQPVPAGHKLAIRAIRAGEAVLRYGENIGRAGAAIAPGQHVHTHNVAFDAGALHYEFPEVERTLPPLPASMPTFLGFPRADGRAGTRNYIAIVAASNCAAYAAELIARGYAGVALPPNVDGVVAFPHGEGCGHSVGPDTAQLQRTLSGVLNHPNVGGAIVLGLGCEVNQVEHYLGSNNPDPSRISGFTMQDAGGTQAAVDAARASIAAMMGRISAEPRVELPASKLVLGLQCGGSDSFSGITANPALGHASDLLAALGASSVLAETPEIFGAEHLLVRRARSRAVAERLLEIIAQYKAYLARFGGSFDDNPSPGNKEGGLTNIVEKSLGAVAKGGTSMLTEVLDYAERISSPGLVFMNTPGYDPVSLSGLAAGGANVFVFTTGRGSTTGFPTVPTIKVASNSATYQRMAADMDINAGKIADGEATVESVGREIFDAILRVASGERPASERLGHNEFVPWRIGPVL